MSGLRVLPSGRSSGHAVSCREATLNDYEQIQALQGRYGMGFKSYEAWSHMWANNPVCKRTPGLPVGWVIVDDRNHIVGSFGSVPFGFELDGKPLIAGTSSGWVVDERYRGYALQLLDRFLSQPGVDLHLCVSPTRDAQPAVALHCERVPAGVWDRAALWITHYRSFAASVLATKGIRFQRVFRQPVAAALMVEDVLTRDRLKEALRSRHGYDVRLCTAFDDRFDELWEHVRARNCHRLLASRTREVLEWHFKPALARGKASVLTLCDGERLVAYAVFCRKDVPPIGLRRVRLIDYQSLDGDTSLLAPILAAAIERCRREGTAVLESIGWELDSGHLMHRIAPRVRTMASWQYYYKAAHPALANRLKDAAAWTPSQYDGDICI